MKVETELLIIAFITNVILSIFILIVNKGWHDFVDKVNQDWYYRNKKLIEIIKALQEKLDEYERKDRE